MTKSVERTARRAGAVCGGVICVVAAGWAGRVGGFAAPARRGAPPQRRGDQRPLKQAPLPCLPAQSDAGGDGGGDGGCADAPPLRELDKGG